MRKGFTLVELLIVITILGILASIVFINLSEVKEKAKIAKAKAEVKEIYNSIIMLSIDTNEWPGHQEVDKINNVEDNELCPDGCPYSLADSEAGLVNTDGNYSNWQGPYMDSMPDDPWGNQYFFDTDYDIDQSEEVEKWAVVVGSYGTNGVGNNQYDSDDVIYIIYSE